MSCPRRDYRCEGHIVGCGCRQLSEFAPSEAYSLPENPRTSVLLVLGCLLLCTSVLAFILRGRERPVQLTMTAGNAAKARHQLALQIAEALEPRGLEVSVQESAGSLAALDLVQSGEMDLALIQGGIRLQGHSRMRQVASISVEPLHLLVRADRVDAVRQNLSALRGCSVDLSTPGSGTNLLSREVLRFAGLSPARDGDVEVMELSYDRLLTRLGQVAASLAGEPLSMDDLPDAVFIISSVPSEVARQLVLVGGYGLVPLKFGPAFSLVSVNEATDDDDRIAQTFIRTTEIPAYASSVSPPVHENTSLTLGTELLVVAGDTVPDDVIARFCGVTCDGPIQQLYQIRPLVETGRTAGTGCCGIFAALLPRGRRDGDPAGAAHPCPHHVAPPGRSVPWDR